MSERELTRARDTFTDMLNEMYRVRLQSQYHRWENLEWFVGDDSELTADCAVLINVKRDDLPKYLPQEVYSGAAIAEPPAKIYGIPVYSDASLDQHTVELRYHGVAVGVVRIAED